MLPTHEIFAIVMVMFSLVFLVLFVRSIFKKENVRVLMVELAGCIAFAIISIVPLIPGSETNFELGPIKYKIKSPSKIAKLTGARENIFEAENTDNDLPKTIVFSAASTSPNTTPDLTFLVGNEYIDRIDRSKDGKVSIVSATIPPGKEVKTSSPEQVIFQVLPDPFFSNQNNEFKK